ncbi:MAG: Cof-type HAD-IIB family hydrolase [Sarcina sp.]
MYKLVAIDMDGTLLNKDSEISQKSEAVIRSVRRKGIKVIISTGRSFEGIRKYLKQLGLLSRGNYAVTCNGAAIYDCGSEKVIEEAGVLISDLKRVAIDCDWFGIKVYGYKLDSLITRSENKFTDLEKKDLGTKIDLVKFEDLNNEDSLIKILVVEDKEFLDRYHEYLHKKYSRDFSVVRSLPYMIEILNKNSNKANAIKFICERLRIEDDEVMAFGDAMNDFEMISTAGFGIAMGNAIPKIKEISDFVTESNNEEGVANALEKFVLNA